MTLLLNSKLFRQPKEFAEVWNTYGMAAKKFITLSREEVSLIGNSLTNFLGGEDKGRTPRYVKGSAGRASRVVSGCASP